MKRLAKSLLSEDQLQKWCIDYAKAMHPSLLIIHIPNGGSRNMIEAAKLKGMGVRSGVCDLLFILPEGKTHWVEMKILGGKVSTNQQLFMNELHERQHPYEVCWSQDEWMALCKRVERAIQRR